MHLLARSVYVRFLLLAVFLAVTSTAQAQAPAAVSGTVFEDANGNGQQDNNETGLAGVVIVAIEEDTGAPITTTTDADGHYLLQAEVINHRIRIDESSLPFTGQLTTNRLEYNLNVPSDFVAPNINFGYQEVEPAAFQGIVFEDVNGDGMFDEGDRGLPDVALQIVHDETGALTEVLTDAEGRYRFEAPQINHRVSIAARSLPFTGQLTTGRDSYNLNVPPNYFAVNINFGYQEVEPAAFQGIVFEDVNGDGTFDDGDRGLPDVALQIVHDETGALTEVLTDAEGRYRFEVPEINHRVSIAAQSLPFTGQLTTGRDSYNLNVPPNFFAPNINFGYQEVEPAAFQGIVFEDVNGDGTFDEGDRGLPDVALQIVHDETGALTEVLTDAEGRYRFEAPQINHRVYVAAQSLPFTGQLTTGRDSYNLNVPPDFFAVNINFGYEEVQPSVVSGTVFEDLNEDGEQNENEKGIPNTTLVVTYRSSGETTEITTDADGNYRHETVEQRFDLAVDTESLPFAEAILTTGRDSYSLNIPNGFVAPNVNFGYRAATADDLPPVVGVTTTTTTDPGSDDNAAAPADDLANPFDDPDPLLPLPDNLPADAGEYLVPLEGLWTAVHSAFSMTCGGMSFDAPASPPETVTLTLEDEGRVLIGQGFEGVTTTLTRSDTVRGLYTGSITVTEQGGSVTLEFFLQVVTPELIVGYLTGEVAAQGVSCDAYRGFEMTYNG